MEEKGKKPFHEYFKFVKEVLHNYDIWDEKTKEAIQQNLITAENKLNDDSLYLGVVGPFSSGKSTFINSVIGRNFLPVDAVQGTTVTITVLKKGSSDDLVILYNNGEKALYSTDKYELLYRYNVITSDNFAFFEKIWLCLLMLCEKARKLFIGKTDTNKDCLSEKDLHKMLLLFKKVISVEEYGKEIESATLKLKELKMRKGIAIVDTPGTATVNERHTRAVQHAIGAVCEVFVVMIPYSEPVSLSLIKFMQENLLNQLDKCIFVVTKIELLQDDIEEYKRLLQVITKRLQNNFNIASPIVLPMPTLLHLEGQDRNMLKSGLFDLMPQEKKMELEMLYEKGLDRIYEILQEKNQNMVENKLLEICQVLASCLENKLNNEILKREIKIKEIKAQQVKALPDFETKINNLININQQAQSINEGLITSEINSMIDRERNFMIKSVQDCDDLENVLKVLKRRKSIHTISEDIVDKLKEQLPEIYKKMEESYVETVKHINSQINLFYGVCNLDNVIVASVRVSFPRGALHGVKDDMENMLIKTLDNLENAVKNETQTMFYSVRNCGPIKYFFGASGSGKKEQCVSDINSTYDNIEQAICLKMISEWEQKNNEMTKYLQEKSKDWQRKNEKKILSYITINNQDVTKNENCKVLAERYLADLKNYVSRLKENNNG